MADDGLLVNFAIEDAGILESQAIFHGGRWKDRLTAKKIAEHRRKKRQIEPSSATSSKAVLSTAKAIAATEDSSVPNNSRPLKRQKLNTDTSNTRPREIVSSLFSSNPTSEHAQKNKEVSVDEIASSTVPSNAPLLDSIHTFTSLGLSSLLATHLFTKLSLRAPTAIQKSAISQLLAEDSDAFLQAETGSGKTLAYLLPIIQRIIQLSPPLSASTAQNEASSLQLQKQVCRASGLFAIILAPTRELCKQISTVLESLLRCAHWIVAGTVIGGEKKKSEKARLRKGVNILVATPGRLADHLENTKALDVSNVRWLVLDEGDRLMELGFEEEIKAIVQKLEARREKAEKLPKSQEKFIPSLPTRRTTVMCSATMKMNVQRLGEISLKEAVHIIAEQSEDKQTGEEKEDNLEKKDGKESEFLAPAQLRQSFIVVPAKQRLVTLAALLRHTFARKGSVMKAIVFLSCADSVDFHFEVFARESSQAFESPQNAPPPLPNRSSPSPSTFKKVPNLKNNDSSLIMKNNEKKNSDCDSESDSNSNKNKNKTNKKSTTSTPTTPNSRSIKTTTQSLPLLLPTVSPTTTLTTPQNNPNLTIHKLHGSLAQPLRTATLAAFARSPNPCILFCTDVASRGLDLPNIDLVVEYDPPFSSDDHLHRVGRTARAGREGRAVIFLMPGKEEGYIDVLEKGYSSRDGIGKGLVKRREGEEILKKGFLVRRGGGKKGGENSHDDDDDDDDGTGTGTTTWEERATEWQLEVERWVIEDSSAGEMAKRAFVSHVRAYATHVAKERGIFNVKELHLGHLAKAFALRDRPGNMGRSMGRKGGSFTAAAAVVTHKRNSRQTTGASSSKKRMLDHSRDHGESRDAPVQDAGKKMIAKMKEQMAAAGEFNIG